MEVEPGTYTLSFWVGDDFQNPIATREVVIPPISEGRTNTPLDLGTIEITPPAPKRGARHRRRRSRRVALVAFWVPLVVLDQCSDI